jgi:hypothetical protein
MKLVFNEKYAQFQGYGCVFSYRIQLRGWSSQGWIYNIEGENEKQSI